MNRDQRWGARLVGELIPSGHPLALSMLLLLALSMLVFLSQNLGANDLVGGDEGYYGIMARNICHGGIRYLANPSLSPLGPPGDKPFLYPLVLAGAIGAGGVDEVPVRFVTLLFAVAAAPLIYLIGRELGKPAAGFWGAVLYLLTPLVAHSGRTVAAEPALVAFSLGGAVLFLRALKGSPLRYGLLAGFFFGLSFLCKLWLMLPPLLAVVAGSWLALRGEPGGRFRGWGRLMSGLVPAFVATAGLQLALCALLTPDTLEHWLTVYLGFSLASRVSGAEFAAYWHRPWYFYGLIIGKSAALWLPLLSVGLCAALDGLRRNRRFTLFGLVVMVWLLPLLPISVASVKSGNYSLPFYPPLLLLAGMGCHALLEYVVLSKPARRFAAAALLSVLLALATQLPMGGEDMQRSRVPLMIQLAWTAALLTAAWLGPRLLPRLALLGCLGLVVAAGLARDFQIVRARHHVTGYARIAERLAPELRDIDPTRPCFHAPEWPSMSFYTFRTGRYWESPYVAADSAEVVEALRGNDPHFFVTDPGVPRLYGGTPAPSLSAMIAREGRKLDLAGGLRADVYLNRSLAIRGE